MRSIAVSLLSLLVIAAALASCKQPPPAGGPRATAGSTGGDLLVISKRHGDQSVLYGVGKNGRIQFAGGQDATIGTYSWTGRMSDADLAALNAVLEKNDWFAEKPGIEGEPKNQFYRVTCHPPSGKRRRFEVKGVCPALDEVLEICDRSARQRFDRVLDELPKPGPQGP